MENPNMTREEAIYIIKGAAARYGLTTCEQYPGGDIPGIERARDGYIDISIRLTERHDYAARTSTCRIEARASVCQMNPNADVAELLRAASEIQTGALFVAELQTHNLTWVELH